MADRMAADKPLTNIELVEKCDAFPDPEKDPNGHAKMMEQFYTLIWHDQEGAVPIGYMPRNVFNVLAATPANIRGDIEFDADAGTVTLFHRARSEPERTKLVARLTAYWRENHTFRILRGWRDELWPVYGRRGEVLFKMERCAVGLVGSARYGIHMVAYLRANPDSTTKYPFRIWVPQRSAHKSTYPGMLDNTVAGGLAADESVEEALVREADEEGSLPADLVRDHAKPAGTITYVFVTDRRSGGESGLIYPECQWIYDLELPADGSVVPKPKDGEVEKFMLCTVEEIQEQMAQGRWKPNCAVVMLDFFIRHGVYTPENEPNYDEILRRSHRAIPFPGPHETFHPQPQGMAY